MGNITIDLAPEQYHVPELMRQAVARQLHVAEESLPELHVVHRTLDCRRRNVVYHTEIALCVPSADSVPVSILLPAKTKGGGSGKTVVVVGAGPAGLFAAMRLLEYGLRPIIVERGKPVEERKHDIARLTREKIVNPDSNWCFGEGGAGTYSDGKLYTRSTKRGDIGTVLHTFVTHGADPNILLDAHAHIGTDRLGAIIRNIRYSIEAAGGEYRFGTKVIDLIVEGNHVRGVIDADGNAIMSDAVILATGHSARDIYYLFDRHNWLLEAKPFALGVRVEHPQELVNEIQYHGKGYSPYLPPATYSLTTQTCGHGVFSFCMCPGGVIVPAATADRQQVVNGMSNSRRNSPWANSGIAVTVGLEDVEGDDIFALLRFQQEVEQRMFHAGGDAVNAPAQRLVDFMRHRISSKLNKTGYMGDVVSAPLHELLPPFIATALAQGFRNFDRYMHGFITEEATLLAVESRTSSPIRIPRDKASLQHPQLQGLYPCGEGAGHAGGIVSSALDGIRSADAVSLQM